MEQQADHFTSTCVRVHHSQFQHSILDRLQSVPLLTGSKQTHSLVYLNKFHEATEKMVSQWQYMQLFCQVHQHIPDAILICVNMFAKFFYNSLVGEPCLPEAHDEQSHLLQRC